MFTIHFLNTDRPHKILALNFAINYFGWIAFCLQNHKKHKQDYNETFRTGYSATTLGTNLS